MKRIFRVENPTVSNAQSISTLRGFVSVLYSFPSCLWRYKGGCCGIFVSLGGRDGQAVFYARLL